MLDRMGTWPALTEEQYAVIITAYEEAATAHIMDEFRARQRWAETGTTRAPSDLDINAKRTMITRFAQVLADMVARGRVLPGLSDHRQRQAHRRRGERDHQRADELDRRTRRLGDHRPRHW